MESEADIMFLWKLDDMFGCVAWVDDETKDLYC